MTVLHITKDLQRKPLCFDSNMRVEDTETLNIQIQEVNLLTSSDVVWNGGETLKFSEMLTK